MNMKRKLYLLLTIAIAAFNFACGGSAATETAKTTAPGSNSAPATKTETKTATMKMSTPSEANESLFNAIKNKDKAAIKQLVSKDTIEILDAAAKEKKMTVDELLDKEFFVNITLPARLEQRNEKITGDKATVEMLTDKNEWDTSNFVKEDSVWKVSLM